MKKQLKTWTLALGLAALFGACTPNKIYVTADREVYKVVAPEYLAYVQADPKLTPAQKNRRALMIEAWKGFIDEAAKAVEDK